MEHSLRWYEPTGSTGVLSARRGPGGHPVLSPEPTRSAGVVRTVARVSVLRVTGLDDGMGTLATVVVDAVHLA